MKLPNSTGTLKHKANVEAPLTGAEAVAAGVPLQLLLAVLTVEVVLAG